ncbi:agmatinase [Marinobacterium lutimaris]|uniref:Agmatinase n=1 Tax=Marinobacterium lutimaris TaxID=568106 RepID=A0A1H6CTM1_9GAMM|nr:agmatinase [Marinobacterium lutimaris]SEG76198.1 agmatinase [Marinobacterium lutimaris]
MSKPLTQAPKTSHKSLLFSEVDLDLDNFRADIAVLGMPYGAAYTPGDYNNDQTNAPTAIRQASDRVIRSPERYDYDIGGPLLQGRTDIRFVDCGDVPADLNDPRAHYARAEEATRKILKGGAMPIILGGDHGITNPILKAYDDQGPLTIVHIDAHLDWRDEVNGVTDGLSSPMRRASELPYVKDMYQIGMRASGSARPEDVEAAAAWGSKVYTAYELHDRGMDAILDEIPDGGNYYITIDADGLDPTCMPAVAGPAPGGVTFLQARKLIHGLVGKGKVVGMDIVEIQPEKDFNKHSCMNAGRLILNLIGASIRAGYFDKNR